MSFANVGSFEPTFFYCWRQPPKASAAGKCICPLPSRCGWDSVGVQKEQAEGVIAVNKRKEGDKGQMTVAQFLEMTAEDRKVVR